MDLLGSAQAILAKFNIADTILALGAVVLAVFAFKVVAKILKFLLIAGAVVLAAVLVFKFLF